MVVMTLYGTVHVFSISSIGGKCHQTNRRVRQVLGSCTELGEARAFNLDGSAAAFMAAITICNRRLCE